MIRWLVDKYIRVKYRDKNLTEEEFVAETDKSSGVLMASGYIAGGALAAVFIAFFAGFWKEKSDLIEHWSRDNNPFFAGTMVKRAFAYSVCDFDDHSLSGWSGKTVGRKGKKRLTLAIGQHFWVPTLL